MQPASETPAPRSLRRQIVPAPGRTLARRRVDLLLGAAGDVAVTLVQAPPGWGKTTALGWLAREGGWTTAWTRLYPGDDGAAITQAILASIERAGQLPAASSQTESLPDRCAAAVARTGDDLLVIVDDAHRAAPGELESALGSLLAEPVPGIHLVLASRWGLDLPVDGLAVQGDLLRVGPADLAFDEAEARRLAPGLPWDADPRPSLMLARLRGWPLGVARTLREAHEPAAPLPAPLLAWLAEQALEPLPPAARAALDHGAALPDLDPVLLHDLHPLAGQGVAWLQANGWFVDQDPIRLQPVMADLMRQFQVPAPAAPALASVAARLGHSGEAIRAASWYLAAGQRAQAAASLLAAADPPLPTILTEPVAAQLAQGTPPFSALALGFALAGRAPAAFAAGRAAVLEATRAGDPARLARAFVVEAAATTLLPRADPWVQPSLIRQARALDPAVPLDTPPPPGTTWHLVVQALAAAVASPDPATVDHLFDLLADHQAWTLLHGPSLHGPRDPMALVPVILAARALPRWKDQADALLAEAFPALAGEGWTGPYHPGSTLRIGLLGHLRLWRGDTPIPDAAWHRDKARRLFAILVAQRGRWIPRDELTSILWPDDDPDTAANAFKVALNAVHAAIEPGRPPRAQPFFIRRRETSYAFAPSTGVWIDVDEFELRVQVAERDGNAAQRSREVALGLYEGDYLEDFPYETWAQDDRLRIQGLYLRLAVSVGRDALARGETATAIAVAERVLRRDAAWEDGWDLLIRAHLQRGERDLALSAWRRCRDAMARELGIEPAPRLERLLDETAAS